jgi:hypothetical protein
VFDAASIIIQYHIFLALALVVAGLGGIVIRAMEKRRMLPTFFSVPEYIVISVLVVVYVFANV